MDPCNNDFIAKLVSLVQRMVEESGDPTGFDADAWLRRWPNEPLPALGSRRPAELMDTVEGRNVLFNLLATAQCGAYW
jgi:uncharacterized protein (DUF2384 family)